MAEHSAVNRRVVGSSPTCGAKNLDWGGIAPPLLHFAVQLGFGFENPDGKFYIGQTANLFQRLIDHNRTDSFDGHFTRKNGPWRLVWYEPHSSRSSAMQRERQIKRMKSLRGFVENWATLTRTSYLILKSANVGGRLATPGRVLVQWALST